MPGRTWLYSDELYYLEEMRRYIEAADMPYRLLVARHMDKRREAPKYAVFASLLIPRIDGLVREIDRQKAGLAGAQLLLGLVAYRNRFGSYPASLDVLKSRLNWQIPQDPFSGKGFVYHRKGRGFMLYSIGGDLKDDHGLEGYRGESGDIVWKLDN
jgi:hypothetical protein